MSALHGQIALVTGASRGIGRAIAEALVAAGARVIGTATTDAGAAAISAWLGANGRGAAVDVSNAASVDALLAEEVDGREDRAGRADVAASDVAERRERSRERRCADEKREHPAAAETLRELRRGNLAEGVGEEEDADELAALLARDGFTSVTGAVGTDL